MAITRNDGAGSRSLIAPVMYPNNVYRQIRALANVTTWPSGGPNSGGDPNFGWPPEDPQIISATPTVTWDEHSWHLGVTLSIAYDPPPDFLYLNVEFDGVNFHADFHQTPFLGTFTAVDLGFALGGTYSAQVQAFTRNKGPSAWSDPFTGIFFATSPLFPPAPTNLRIDPTYGTSGYLYDDTGVSIGLLWDYAGPTPVDWWHIDWWDVADAGHPQHWLLPGSWGLGVIVPGLLRTHNYHFEMWVERGQYPSNRSTPFLPTIPVENPQPPSAAHLDLVAIPPYGYSYGPGGRGAVALAWTAPTDGLNTLLRIIYGPTADPNNRTTQTIPGSSTHDLFPNVQSGLNYDFNFYSIDRWGYVSTAPYTITVAIPAANPPAPTGLALDTGNYPPAGYSYQADGPHAGLTWNSVVGYTPAPGAEIHHVTVWITDNVRNDVWYYVELPPTILLTLSAVLARLRAFTAHLISVTTFGAESGTPSTLVFTVPSEPAVIAAPVIGASGINEQGGWFTATWGVPTNWNVSAWVLYWQLHGAPGGSKQYSETLGPNTLTGTENRNLLSGRQYDVWVGGVTGDGTTVVLSGLALVTIPADPRFDGIGGGINALYSSPDQPLAGWDVQSLAGAATYARDTSVVISGGASIKLTVTS